MPSSYDVTNINTLGLVFIIIMGILTIFLPRRFAIVPVIVTCLHITLGQVLVIAGLHFTAMRIIVLFGWIRLIGRKEFSSIKVNEIDIAIICWVISNMVMYNLLRQTSTAFFNRLGFAYNAIGIYFLFRFLIRDFSEISRSFKIFAIAIVPLTIAMLFEQLTSVNLFSVFGGVPVLNVVREGRFRSQGPFISPILAGTFGATLIPFFVALWFKEQGKKFAIIGALAATFITLAAASGGPVMSYIFGFIGLSMWPLRKHMRAVQWTSLFLLIFAHIFMKAPVWYLMARASSLVGGGGWHRSYLIDQAIAHFNEWWLLGIEYTAHWMPTALEVDPNNADITNQFLAQGVQGGLLTMILLILVIVLGFRAIGKALKILENQPFSVKITLWSMGAALFAHVMSFMSVSYFDQIMVSWYFLLAAISTANSQTKLFRDQKNIAEPILDVN